MRDEMGYTTQQIRENLFRIRRENEILDKNTEER